MSDLQQTGKRAWFGALAFIALVLVWQWFSLGATKSGREIKPDALQTVSGYDIGAALEDVLKRNLFEPDRKYAEGVGAAETGQAVPEVVPEVSLQFKALVQKGEHLQAVIGSANDPLSFKKYAEGDILPNGKVLQKIDADKITYGDAPQALTEPVSSEEPNSSEEPSSSEEPQSGEVSESESTTLYLFGRMGSASE